jgi:hypothetical protein
MDASTLQTLLDELWPELPVLLGDDWATLAPTLAAYRQQLAAGELEPAIALAYILVALRPHPRAFDRLRALASQAAQDTTRSAQQATPVASAAEALAADATTANLTRYIDISAPGESGSTRRASLSSCA